MMGRRFVAKHPRWASWMETGIRHVIVAATMWALYAWFLSMKAGVEGGTKGTHALNQAWADASLVLYAVALVIGPLARFWRPARHALAWRRELGVYGTVAAFVHVGIYWDHVFHFDWRGFFYPFHRTDAGLTFTDVPRKDLFASANWIGLAALAYATVLALTSNNLSQRLLGRGWSFLQNRATTMWILVIVHTFLFVGVQQHRHHWNDTLLWTTFGAVLGLQVAAFAWTLARREGGRNQAATD